MWVLASGNAFAAAAPLTTSGTWTWTQRINLLDSGSGYRMTAYSAPNSSTSATIGFKPVDGTSYCHYFVFETDMALLDIDGVVQGVVTTPWGPSTTGANGLALGWITPTGAPANGLRMTNPADVIHHDGGVTDGQGDPGFTSWSAGWATTPTTAGITWAATSTDWIGAYYNQLGITFSFNGSMTSTGVVASTGSQGQLTKTRYLTATGTGTPTGSYARMNISGPKSLISTGFATPDGTAAMVAKVSLKATGVTTSTGRGKLYNPRYVWGFTEPFLDSVPLETHWTVARQSSGLATDPQLVGHLSNWPPSAGGAYPVGPDPIGDTVVAPDDVAILNGELWVGTGAQYYGDTNVRCAVPFSFPSQTGAIEFDCWIPLHYPLFGWPHVMVSERPWSAPSSWTDNSHGPVMERGFDIRLNAGQQSIAGTFYPRPRVFQYNNFIETELTAADTGTGLINTVQHHMTTVLIEFTATHLLVSADGVPWFDSNWTMPSGFTSGFFSLCNHNHAADKYGREIPPGPSAPLQVSHTYTIYDNVSFTARGDKTYPTCKVPDNIQPGDMSGIGLTGYSIGWDLPTSVLSFPPLPIGTVKARLICSLGAMTSLTTSSTRMVYKLNGGTAHQVPFHLYVTDDPGTTGMNMFSIDVDPAELVAGVNTVEFPALVNHPAPGISPYVFNVELVTEPSDFIATGTATSTGTAALRQSMALTATGISTSSGSAALNQTWTMSSTGVCAATGSGQIVRPSIASPLTATGVATSTGTAELTRPPVTMTLTATGVAVAVGTGNIVRPGATGKIRIGTAAVTAVKRGTTPVSKMYIGTMQVWP
jgi:hypothetical protein